jgi:hypothetical protein
VLERTRRRGANSSEFQGESDETADMVTKYLACIFLALGVGVVLARKEVKKESTKNVVVFYPDEINVT